ncbi:MAG: hypothetical protein ACJ77E_18250 [Gaiellaceae bacterium]
MSAFTLAVALAAATTAAPGTSDATPMTISDVTGDSATAPDLTKVTLTPGKGTVTVDITFAGTLGSDGGLVTVIDADRNQQTGDNGIDYIVAADASGLAFQKWNGTDFVDFTHQPTNASLTATDLTYMITLADIGSVTSFAFSAGGLRGDDVDTAPDSGLATYTAPAVATPSLKGIRLPVGALVAHAGKVLRLPALTVLLSDGTIADPDTQTCALKYKGQRIAAVAGGCAWKIPKAYRKARLVLTVTVSYGGKTASKTTSVRVR